MINKKGFSLIEILIAATLGTVLIYGVMQGSLMSMQAVQVSKTAQAELYLETNIRTMLSDNRSCKFNLLHGANSPPGVSSTDYFSDKNPHDLPKGRMKTSDNNKRDYFKIINDPDFATTETDDVPMLKHGSFSDGLLEIKSMEVTKRTGEPKTPPLIADQEVGELTFIVYYTKPQLGRFKTKGGPDNKCEPFSTQANNKAGCYSTNPVKVPYKMNDNIDPTKRHVRCDIDKIKTSISESSIEDKIKALCGPGQVLVFKADNTKVCQKVVNFTDRDSTNKPQLICGPNEFLKGFLQDGQKNCAKACYGGGGRYWNKDLDPPACACPAGKTWNGINCV